MSFIQYVNERSVTTVDEGEGCLLYWWSWWKWIFAVSAFTSQSHFITSAWAHTLKHNWVTAISLIPREINKLSTLSQKGWLAYYLQYYHHIPLFHPLLVLHSPLFGYSHFHETIHYVENRTAVQQLHSLVLFLEVVLKAAQLRDAPPSVCGLFQLYILYSSSMIPPSEQY